MNLSRRVNSLTKNAALWAGVAMAVLCTALAGLGFLIAGFYIFLTQYINNAAAAAATGGVMLAIAILIGTIGGGLLRRMRRKQPSLVSEFGGTIGMAGRLVGLLVRKDPKKAMIISLVTGALAEYILADKRER
jgi:hypothetical protein